MCVASQGRGARFDQDTARVVTGSSQGEIFMWKMEKRCGDGSLIPLPSCVLTMGIGASHAPVVAVVAAFREDVEEVHRTKTTNTPEFPQVACLLESKS